MAASADVNGPSIWFWPGSPYRIVGHYFERLVSSTYHATPSSIRVELGALLQCLHNVEFIVVRTNIGLIQHRIIIIDDLRNLIACRLYRRVHVRELTS